MKTTQYCVFALALVFLTTPAGAAVYFADDFNSYADEAALAAAGWISAHVDGWTTITTPPGPGCYEILNPPAPYSAQSSTTDWQIGNYGGVTGPPTVDGSSAGGKFLTSDSDWGPLSDVPDSGASHDVYSPIFSTVGASSTWLHVAVDAIENNNYAKACFMIDYSKDGGATWTNAWLRVGSARSVATGSGTGVLCTTYVENHRNVGGYFGQLDVDLSAVANEAAVKLRFRHYEPSDDWQFMIDDVKVDDVAAPTAGPYTVFAENFSAAGAPTMGAMVLSGGAWNNSPGALFKPEAKPDVDLINRIGHPAAVPTPGALPEFAVAVGSANAWMMTPLLNLSNMTKVTLAYEDELKGGKNAGDGTQEVLLMQDNGNGVADAGDTVLATVFKYQNGAWERGGEDSYYAERSFNVSAAAGLDNVFFAWHNNGGYFWAIDNIEVSGVPEPSTIALLIGAALMGLVAYRRRG
jgi:hypothetical protein